MPQFQAEVCGGSRLVEPLVGNIGSGCARYVLHALIGLTAPFDSSSRNVHVALYVALRTCKND